MTETKLTRKQKGFTLLEVLISLALLVGFVTLVFPLLGGFLGSQIEDDCDNLALVVERLRDEALSRRLNVRLVLDLESEEPNFWAESTSSDVLLIQGIDRERLGIREMEALEERLQQIDSQFRTDGALLVGSQKLSSGVYFKWVRVGEHVLNYGQVPITFFKNGRTQPTEIKVADDEQNARLIRINPYSGRVEILPVDYHDEFDI